MAPLIRHNASVDDLIANSISLRVQIKASPYWFREYCNLVVTGVVVVVVVIDAVVDKVCKTQEVVIVI